MFDKYVLEVSEKIPKDLGLHRFLKMITQISRGNSNLRNLIFDLGNQRFLTFSEISSYLKKEDGDKSQQMVKDYKRFRSEVRKGLRKVTVTICDECLDWFYQLSRTMKKKKGYRLPRSYIIRALIDVCMKLDINVEGVRTENDLEERILQAIKKY